MKRLRKLASESKSAAGASASGRVEHGGVPGYFSLWIEGPPPGLPA